MNQFTRHGSGMVVHPSVKIGANVSIGHGSIIGYGEPSSESTAIYRGSVIGVNALLVGPRRIGPCAYVAAGEIVRSDVGEGMMACKGGIQSLASYRGVFKARC